MALELEQPKLGAWGDEVSDDESKIAHDYPILESAIVADIATRSVNAGSVYSSLLACGMLLRESNPPQQPSIEDGHSIQMALYNAYYLNPRGAKCSAKIGICHKRLTDCLHARIVHIIYGIVIHRMKLSPGDKHGIHAEYMTEENISNIDIKAFRSVPGMYPRFVGDEACSAWALYLNAKTHVECFNHTCLTTCPILRASRGFSGGDRNLQRAIMFHVATYEHETEPLSVMRRGDRRGDGAASADGMDGAKPRHKRGGRGRKRMGDDAPRGTVRDGVSYSDIIRESIAPAK